MLIAAAVLAGGAATWSDGAGGCPADLNGSGDVSTDDLLIWLSAWGSPGPGDLDGNGVVNVNDLLIMIDAWGPCPVQEPCPGAGDCFEQHTTPGCADGACCKAVCSIDDFCCEVQWDGICVVEAFDLCGPCGDADAGDCCLPHDAPGCDQWECCQEVCFDDPFCCLETWDSQCAALADLICSFCP